MKADKKFEPGETYFLFRCPVKCIKRIADTVTFQSVTTGQKCTSYVGFYVISEKKDGKKKIIVSEIASVPIADCEFFNSVKICAVSKRPFDPKF